MEKKSIFDDYNMVGFDFDDDGIMHIKFVKKGESYNEDETMTHIDCKGMNADGSMNVMRIYND